MMSGGGTVMKREAKHNFEVYRACDRCKHVALDEDEEPCNDCFDIVGHPNWEAKESGRLDGIAQAIATGAKEGYKDFVNSPSHYNTGEIEVIDYIEDQLTSEGYLGYLEGNIIKYVSRYKHKNGVEDLRKAEWHLKRLIGVLEKGRE
jgi:hypothetical protein